jgi:hypothetical protein
MVLEGLNDLITGASNMSFENVYDMTLDELILLGFVFICSFIFSAFVSAIFKMLSERRWEEVEWVNVDETPVGVGEEKPEPPPEPELSPRERLSRREEELRKREEAVKSERMKELVEREKYIKTRVEGSTGREETAIAGVETPADSVEQERTRIKKMLEDAERRFAAGEISEKNFRTIAEDYQSRLIDLDIKIRKKGKDGEALFK